MHICHSPRHKTFSFNWCLSRYAFKRGTRERSKRIIKEIFSVRWKGAGCAGNNNNRQVVEIRLNNERRLSEWYSAIRIKTEWRADREHIADLVNNWSSVFKQSNLMLELATFTEAWLRSWSIRRYAIRSREHIQSSMQFNRIKAVTELRNDDRMKPCRLLRRTWTMPTPRIIVYMRIPLADNDTKQDWMNRWF